MLKQFLKKWLFFFTALGFSLAAGQRTSVGFYYFLFWFFLSLWVLGLLWVVVMFSQARLSFARRFESRIEEGETIEIETEVSHKGFLPLFNLVVEDDLAPAGLAQRRCRMRLDFLKPRSSVFLRYNCLCRQRGQFEIGPFAVYFFDLFGLFFLKKTFKLSSAVYVYPKMFSLSGFPALAKGSSPWFGIQTAHVSGDDDEFYGVREYREADPVKRVHWLSTARKNRLMVREFQRQSFFRATVIFNLEQDRNYGQGKESTAEYTVRIAASVSKFLIQTGVSVEVIAHTGEMVCIPFNKGAGHLEAILDFLAAARAQSRVSLAEVFEQAWRQASNDTTLIVIACDQDWVSLEAMLSLQKRSIALIPLILIASSFVYQGVKTPRKAGIDSRRQGTSCNAPLFFHCGDNLEHVFAAC